MANTQFEKDVAEGLSQQQKQLSSKYFYNDQGSRIFQEIMEMSEYYLTDKEFEIFNHFGGEIYDKLNFKKPFQLIELGAGDGIKTAELIRHLIARNVNFTYTPIDISKEANDMLSAKLKKEFPTLKIEPKTGDYFEILADFKKQDQPVLLLFIGSNIGNYKANEVLELFHLFQKSLNQHDKLLIGADLKKNPTIIRQAYFDPNGITKRFNINLLKRINEELNGNFNIEKFDFYASYDPKAGEVNSYLVSLQQQEVKINNVIYPFDKGETIWTELSKKYDLKELSSIAENANFKLVHHFLDKECYFTDSLFEKIE